MSGGFFTRQATIGIRVRSWYWDGNLDRDRDRNRGRTRDRDGDRYRILFSTDIRSSILLSPITCAYTVARTYERILGIVS